MILCGEIISIYIKFRKIFFFFLIKTIVVIYSWIKSNCTRKIMDTEQSSNHIWSDVENKASAAKVVAALFQIFLTKEKLINWKFRINPQMSSTKTPLAARHGSFKYW